MCVCVCLSGGWLSNGMSIQGCSMADPNLGQWEFCPKMGALLICFSSASLPLLVRFSSASSSASSSAPPLLLFSLRLTSASPPLCPRFFSASPPLLLRFSSSSSSLYFPSLSSGAAVQRPLRLCSRRRLRGLNLRSSPRALYDDAAVGRGASRNPPEKGAWTWAGLSLLLELE